MLGFFNEVFAALDHLDSLNQRARLQAGIWEWSHPSLVARKAMVDRVILDPPGTLYSNAEAADFCGRNRRTMNRWRKQKEGPKHLKKRVKGEAVVMYTRESLIDWLKADPKHQREMDVMTWCVDHRGHVARTGDRRQGSLLDLVRAPHASQESLRLALALYAQEVADTLDEAVWRLADMPNKPAKSGGFL